MVYTAHSLCFHQLWFVVFIDFCRQIHLCF